MTAEINPPRGAGTDGIRRKVEAVRDWVDALNVTDNQSAFARLSSLAGSVAVLQAGVDPVMQVTCRDRNRIALQSDLLGASSLGIRNILLLTGDKPTSGDHPDAVAVFDLSSDGLMAAAKLMRDEHTLLSGRTLDPAPDLFIGAVDDPFLSVDAEKLRLESKVASGAQFVQTQFVFDVDTFGRWLTRVRDSGLDQQCHVLAGVGPIRSLNGMEYMQNNIPGIRIPEDVERRLRGVPAEKVAEEGITICVETVQRLRELPGVAGVHLMTIGAEAAIPDILQRAGVPPVEQR